MKNSFYFTLFALLLAFSCTKDKGEITVQFTKATAVYGDLDEIRNQDLIEASKEIVNPGKIFVGTDVLLIGEENEGIHVYDNSNPVTPTSVLFINLPFTKEFYVKDNYIYAESHYDMVKINLQNVQGPFIESRLEFALGNELINNNGETLLGFNFEKTSASFELNSEESQLLSEHDHLYFDYQENLIPHSAVPSSFAGNGNNQSGTVNRIVKHNNHVYALGFSKIHVFEDLSSGLSNTDTQIATGFEMETIYPQDDNLFIGTRSSVAVYNISNPNEPTYVSEFFHEESCDPVLPNDDVAYTTLRTGDFTDCPGNVNALLTLDISNVNNPIEVSEIEMESPYGMTINNNLLYVGEGANGMKVFDITDRFLPALIKHDTGVQAYDIIVHPTISDLILTAGPNGIEQYELDPNTLNLNLISSIDY